MHDIDLYSHFPSYNKFTFDTDFCSDALEYEMRGNYDDRVSQDYDEWVRNAFFNAR